MTRIDHPLYNMSERQRTRDAQGRYSEMTPCDGECGKRMARDGGKYWSHQLTDSRDAEGRSFDDAGIFLCPKCAKACADQTTLREFGRFVAANMNRRKQPVPAFVQRWIDGD